MSTHDKITVVVVSYFSRDWIAGIAQELAGDTNFGLIVVDNSSSQVERESLESLARKLDFELLVSGVNIGFGGGVNLALQGRNFHDNGYVFIVNPDVEFSKHQVVALWRAAVRSDYDLVSPRITTGRESHSDWYRGGRISKSCGSVSMRGKRPRFRQDADVETVPVSFATGAAMMLRLSAFRQAGGFDEKYFLYWEDVDFCFRLSQLGFRIGFVPSVTIWHAVGGTSSRFEKSTEYFYYMMRNRVFFSRQMQKPMAMAWPCALRTLVFLVLLSLIQRNRRFVCIRAIWIGLVHGARGRAGRWSVS